MMDSSHSLPQARARGEQQIDPESASPATIQSQVLFLLALLDKCPEPPEGQSVPTILGKPSLLCRVAWPWPRAEGRGIGHVPRGTLFLIRRFVLDFQHLWGWRSKRKSSSLGHARSGAERGLCQHLPEFSSH